MDIQLPGMDGITALKQLSSDQRTKKITVIVVTASAMTHNRETMLAEGFDGYQTKPISLKEFLEEVRKVLDLHQSGGGTSWAPLPKSWWWTTPPRTSSSWQIS